jgi:hypothetical protein
VQEGYILIVSSLLTDVCKVFANNSLTGLRII